VKLVKIILVSCEPRNNYADVEMSIYFAPLKRTLLFESWAPVKITGSPPLYEPDWKMKRQEKARDY
jgi:hypothetical protein